MSAHDEAPDWDTIDRIRWIDELCDRFEDARKADRPLTVAEFLRGAGLDPDTADPELVRELNRVDAAYAPAGAVSTMIDVVGGLLASSSVQPTRLSAGALFSNLSNARAEPPVVPGYQVLEKIDEGGMGVVYRAYEPSIGRNVAIKVLRDGFRGHPGRSARFVAEARLTGRLQHPGVPPVFEVGVLADGSPFLAMKLIEGHTLRRVLGAPDRPDATGLIAIFESICQTVAYAHSRGILHRDLKPANVMVGAFGEVQVMDWGLAKVLAGHEPAAGEPGGPDAASGGPRASDDVSRRGSVAGSPAYMAPEQARGEVERVDRQSDVFGLGGLLCEILTGRPPFVGETWKHALQAASAGNVAGCFARLDGCEADPDLVALCKRCLSPDKEGRPADAGTVAVAVADLRRAAEERLRQAALDRVKAESERAAAETRAEAEARTRRVAEEKTAEERKRRRWQLAGAGAVVLLGIGAGLFLWNEEKRAADRKAAELKQNIEDERRAAKEQVRAAEEQARVGRNRDEFVRLLADCEQALRASDADRAQGLLSAMEPRVTDAKGELEGLTARLTQCYSDLRVLAELNDVDSFRWTLIDNRLPDDKAQAARWAGAFMRLGIVPGTTPTGEATERVNGSLVRDRLLTALDLWLVADGPPEVRTLLRSADPDEYRERVRDAVSTKDGKALALLTTRPEYLRQPERFANVLGQNANIKIELRYKILRLYINKNQDNYRLLLSMGFLFPNNKKEGTEERVRWFQAAVAAQPRNLVAHNSLGIALWYKGDVEGAIREYEAAIAIDSRAAAPHCNLGIALHDKGDVEGAIRAFKAAIALDPTFAHPHDGLGVVLKTKGDMEGAIREFEAAIALGPKISHMRHNLGIALGDKGDVEGAIKVFTAAITLDPKNADMRDGLGNVLKNKGDLAGAIKEFEAAITLDPKLAQPHIGLGSVLQDKGDLAGAIKEFEAAITLDPKDARPHNNLGVALWSKGDLAGAIKEFEAAIALDPKLALPHNGLGNVLQDKGDLAGAIKEFEAAIALEPKFASAHHNLGRALDAKGDLAGAIKEFEAAIALDPKFALPHNGLGNMLRNKGDLAGAIREFKAAIALDPKLALPHNGLGNVLCAKGDLAGAIKEFKAAIALDPKDNVPHNGLGNALCTKGDLEGAIKAYKVAIALNPKTAVPHNGLGVALCAKGDLAGAIKEFEAAIALDPKLALPHNGLGDVLQDKGDLAGAIKEFEAAIALDPKLAQPHNGLGVALWSKGDPAGAIKEFEAAIALDPKDARPHNNLGNALRGKGDLVGAVKAYEAAIALDPKFAVPHTGLGMALSARGDLTGAIKAYKAAIALDPDDATPHNNLAATLQAKQDRPGAISEYRIAARLKIRFALTYINLAGLLNAEGEHYAALQVLREGLRVDPRFIGQFRGRLACYACLVASGQAKDAPPKIDAPALRREALGWLTDELRSARALVPAGKSNPAVSAALGQWLVATALASVRDVEKLPAEERPGWEKFWADVRQFRDDSAPRPVAPPPHEVRGR